MKFWEKVNFTDTCWLWTGSKSGKMGYGSFRKKRAHRVAWELTYGAIPKGMWVLHDCDVPLCVNPQHLHLGTPKMNVKEMYERGRDDHRGERNPHARLTGEQVQAIRSRWLEMPCFEQVGREFGVNSGTIWFIVHERTWKHLPVAPSISARWSARELRSGQGKPYVPPA